MPEAKDQLPSEFKKPKRVERDPTSIFIDPLWQRSISPRGRELIESMVRKWDWLAFTEPGVYFDAARGVEVAFDGQHTLTAAAARADIKTLPMNLYESLEHAKDAAHAFSVRNTSRIPVNSYQLYRTNLVAGYPWAVRLDEISKKLRFEIALYSSGAHNSKPDLVLAIYTMKKIMEARSSADLERIMKVLVGISISPIRDVHIRAVELLLYGDAYRGLVGATALRQTLRGLNHNVILREAMADAAMRGMTQYAVLASIYYREYQKVHGK